MNLKFNKDLINRLKSFSLALVLVTPFSLTGCKKAECDVRESHAHVYVNDEGYVRYINKERLKYEGYTRNDSYIYIDGQEDFYKFLDKKNLMRIDENLEIINQTQEKQVDFIEYRYKYTYMQPIPHTRKVGNTTTTYYTYSARTRYSWTSNPNHSRLTGETRLCHYVYIAYKVEKNDKGKYVLIPSDYVEDLNDIKDKYQYVKETYYKIVTSDGKEVDYEDGKQEDLTPEEKERAEEYDYSNGNEQTVKPQAFSRRRVRDNVKNA